MALHPEVAQLQKTLRDAPRISSLTPEAARAAILARQRAIPWLPAAVASTEDVEIPGPAGPLKARVYRPGGDPLGRIVFFHGGGWVIGGIEEWDRGARAITVATGCELISVDYRLAPEHPYPAAVEDADAAVRWAAEQDGPPLLLMGDSSGGTLATVAASHAVAAGIDVALQVLIYPITDAAMDTPSYARNAEMRPVGRVEMEWYWDHYAPAGVDRSHPDVAPLRREVLGDGPPAIVLVAGYDLAHDEGVVYAERLKAAGVDVTLLDYDDMQHGFFTMTGALTRADEAMEEVGALVRSALSS
jgi:acetyl esterase